MGRRVLLGPQVLPLILTLSLVSCSGERADPPASQTESATTPSGAPDPSTGGLLEPFSGEVRDAPRKHHDEYAGFSADIPVGWKLINSGFGYHYAPSRDAFWIYPDHQDSFGKPEMFSVWIVAHQDTSARKLARIEFDSARDDEGRAIREIRVAGRRGYEVRDSGRGCERCVDRHVFVQWDRETAIRFNLFTYKNHDFNSRIEVFGTIYASLKRATVDDFAVEIRGFLQARRAGRGAESYLGPTAKAAYERRGSLYGSSNCGDIEGYRVLSVVHDADLGTLYEVEAGDMEVLRLQRGPGTAVVAEWQEFRECGTS